MVFEESITQQALKYVKNLQQPGHPTLPQVMSQHKAILCGEIHNDPDLITKYEKIFQAAQTSGIKDVMIEKTLAYDAVNKEQIAIIRQEQAQGKNLDDYLNNPNWGDSRQKILVLAVKYGVNVHCVDDLNQPTRDLALITWAENMMKSRNLPLGTSMRTVIDFANEGERKSLRIILSNNPNTTNATTMKEAEILAEFNDVAKRRNYKPEELPGNQNLKDLLFAERRKFDGKIAENCLEKAGGKPFILIFGDHHMSRRAGDIEDMIKTKLGKENVAYIRMHESSKAEEGADYSMDKFGKLTPSPERAIRAIDEKLEDRRIQPKDGIQTPQFQKKLPPRN